MQAVPRTSAKPAAPDGIHPQSDELIRLRLLARDLLSRPRQPARSVVAGGHHSRFRGRGMDYLESRGYQAGDDIRNMDWRVTARSGRAHVKVYQEERERPVLLWLDLGNSMMFATRQCYKAVIAAQCATTIAWSAAGNNDRVGGLVFGDNEHYEIKPRRSKQSLLQLLFELDRGMGQVGAEDDVQRDVSSFGLPAGQTTQVSHDGIEALARDRHFDRLLAI